MPVPATLVPSQAGTSRFQAKILILEFAEAEGKELTKGLHTQRMILVTEAKFTEANFFGKSGGHSRVGLKAKWLTRKRPRGLLSLDRGQKARWIKEEEEPAFPLI